MEENEQNSNNNPPEEKKPVDPVKNNEPSIAQVFEEDVVAVDDIKASEVDEDDFSANPSEEKTEEEKNSSEGNAGDPAQGKNDPEEKKNSAEERKNADDKNAVVRRMFNPETALLAFDILAKKGGRVATPDRPDYFRMSQEDKTDFATLLRLTAEEEDWSAIPTKYLLGIAGFFWAFGKFYKWNKPHLWDDGELGDKYVKKDPKAIADDAIAEYVRERAKSDSEMGNKELKKLVEFLTEQNIRQQKNIENILHMMQSNNPGAESSGTNIHDVPFEDLPPDKFVDGYDMDMIDFTDNGALIDESKAGQEGFAIDGKKIGRPTKRDSEIYSHWTKYHAWKRKHLKVAS